MESLFTQNHDRLCRCVIDLNDGKVVQVVFDDGRHVSGKITKKDSKIFIGRYRLNGKMITGVYPKY